MEMLSDSLNGEFKGKKIAFHDLPNHFLPTPLHPLFTRYPHQKLVNPQLFPGHPQVTPIPTNDCQLLIINN